MLNIMQPSHKNLIIVEFIKFYKTYWKKSFQLLYSFNFLVAINISRRVSNNIEIYLQCSLEGNIFYDVGLVCLFQPFSSTKTVRRARKSH